MGPLELLPSWSTDLRFFAMARPTQTGSLWILESSDHRSGGFSYRGPPASIGLLLSKGFTKGSFDPRPASWGLPSSSVTFSSKVLPKATLTLGLPLEGSLHLRSPTLRRFLQRLLQPLTAGLALGLPESGAHTQRRVSFGGPHEKEAPLQYWQVTYPMHGSSCEPWGLSPRRHTRVGVGFLLGFFQD
jgi:hypothetical protein